MWVQFWQRPAFTADRRVSGELLSLQMKIALGMPVSSLVTTDCPQAQLWLSWPPWLSDGEVGQQGFWSERRNQVRLIDRQCLMLLESWQWGIHRWSWARVSAPSPYRLVENTVLSLGKAGAPYGLLFILAGLCSVSKRLMAMTLVKMMMVYI